MDVADLDVCVGDRSADLSAAVQDLSAEMRR
jgi:hypothetical protein